MAIGTGFGQLFRGVGACSARQGLWLFDSFVILF